jgi:arylsulfatase A-like enzyme
VDKTMEKLFRYLDTRIGMANVLVVLTADHGIPSVPELSILRKIGGGRMPPLAIGDAIQARLDARFGKAKWLLNAVEESIFLDKETMRQKKLAPAEVERVAAEAALSVPHVARVYTREQLLMARPAGDQIDRRVLNSFHPLRGPVITIVLEPYWMFSATGVNHGSPYGYDSHVPVIFMGPGIKPGRYHRATAPNDIAPTLATMLDVEIPSGSGGRVLDEMLAAGW